MSVGKHVDFKMLDEKGRKIGARVTITRYPNAPADVLVWATRDGEVFGAVPRSRKCGNYVIEAEVRRRLTSMVKRYAKKLNLLADGCHAKWVCSESGTILTVRDAADYEDDPSAGKYFLICETHGACVGVETKALGRSRSGIDFCDDCREAAGS